MIVFNDTIVLQGIGDILSSIAEYISLLFLERLRASRGEKPYLEALRSLEIPAALYMHVPYCHTPLCAFCCFVRRPMRSRQELVEYHRFLRREASTLASIAEGVKVTSIYVGGGTPSIEPSELAETLDAVREAFGARTASISVEVHPRDASEELVEALRGLVHRVSVGVQALDPARLERMGRLNTTLDETLRAVTLLKGRFHTLNIDVVWGVPGDNPLLVAREARRALSLGADQVTFYPVMPTPATRAALRAARAGPWSREEPLMYNAILSEAEGAGYKPCTPWCMCRDSGLIDEYVVESPWFLALGVSGISRIPGMVAVNTFSIRSYMERVGRGGLSVERAARATCVEEALYTMLSMLFGLEYTEGSLVKLHGPCAAPVERLASLTLRALGESVEGGRWRVVKRRTLYLLHRAQHALYTALASFRHAMLSSSTPPPPPRPPAPQAPPPLAM